MTSDKTTTWVNWAFFVSMVVKGINGLLELVAGFSLLLISSHHIQQFVSLITTDELSEDPSDFIGHLVLTIGHHLGEVRLFGGVYLLLHGVVKLVLVWFLLHRKISAYPWALAVLSLLTTYEVYVAWHRWSIFLLLLTVVDITIIGLVWLEYKRLIKETKKVVLQNTT